MLSRAGGHGTIHAMGNVRKQAVAIKGTGNLEESLSIPPFS